LERVWHSIGEYANRLASSWGSYAAFATFVVYLFGYLSLRFHLTALGIDAELNVLDERYLFAGARFLVYFVATVPTLVLLALLLSIPLAVLYYLIRWLLPERFAAPLARRLRDHAARLRAGWLRPGVLALAGVTISVLLIQLVMRQCFVLGNLLVADALPGPPWLQALLVSADDGVRSLYFVGLAAGVTLCGALFVASLAGKPIGTGARALIMLLGLLLAVQLLLLPINHGTIIAGKAVPKVHVYGEANARLFERDDAWTLWEGNETLTLLVRSNSQDATSWRIVSLPREDVKRMDTSRFDQVLRLVHAPSEPR
jgi:hypothetical protein